jgi:hypothetical protein
MTKVDHELWKRINEAVIRLNSLRTMAECIKISKMGVDKNLSGFAGELEAGIRVVMDILGAVKELQREGGIIIAPEAKTEDGRFIIN